MPKRQDPPADELEAGMVREGSPEGGPSVRFDPERHANFNLNTLGERVYHERPPGFRFRADGTLYPVGLEEGEAPEKSGPVDVHAGIAPAEKEG